MPFNRVDSGEYEASDQVHKGDPGLQYDSRNPSSVDSEPENFQEPIKSLPYQLGVYCYFPWPCSEMSGARGVADLSQRSSTSQKASAPASRAASQVTVHQMRQKVRKPFVDAPEVQEEATDFTRSTGTPDSAYGSGNLTPHESEPEDSQKLISQIPSAPDLSKELSTSLKICALTPRSASGHDPNNQHYQGNWQPLQNPPGQLQFVVPDISSRRMSPTLVINMIDSTHQNNRGQGRTVMLRANHYRIQRTTNEPIYVFQSDIEIRPADASSTQRYQATNRLPCGTVAYDGERKIYLRRRTDPFNANWIRVHGILTALSVSVGQSRPCQYEEFPQALTAILGSFDNGGNHVRDGKVYIRNVNLPVPEIGEIRVVSGRSHSVERVQGNLLNVIIDTVPGLRLQANFVIDILAWLLNVGRSDLDGFMADDALREKVGAKLKGLWISDYLRDGNEKWKRIVRVVEPRGDRRHFVFPDVWMLEVHDLRGQNPQIVAMERHRLVRNQEVKWSLKHTQLRDVQRALQSLDFQAETSITRVVEGSCMGNDMVAEEFDVTINRNMLELQGRVLDPPLIQYSTEVLPVNGEWKRRGRHFLHGATIDKWAIAVLTDPNQGWTTDAAIDSFVRKLQDYAGNAGMMISAPLVKHRPGNSSVKDVFNHLVKKYDPQLILVIISSDSSIYGEIRRLGDCSHGIFLQFVGSNAIQSDDNRFVNPLCRKMNAQMGGMNSVISWSMGPAWPNDSMMFFGVHTAFPRHWEPENQPVIVSVVGSLDEHPYRYAAQVRLQKRDANPSGDIAEMVNIVLNKYKSCMKQMPMHLIFYRSELENDTVVSNEIDAIKKACWDIRKDYNPSITYIQAETDHPTRIFSKHPNPLNTVPVGTVVDHTITDPNKLDFYLSTLQQPGKPTRYTVHWNGAQFHPSIIQEMTHKLCYTGQTPISSATPAPDKYARMVCSRAREHLQGLDWTTLDEKKRAVRISKNIVDKMYFL